MKKKLLTIGLVLGLAIGASAQTGFFNRGEDMSDASTGNREDPAVQPFLPNHGSDQHEAAPLGGGALLLIGFGAAYAMSKKRKN